MRNQSKIPIRCVKPERNYMHKIIDRNIMRRVNTLRHLIIPKHQPINASQLYYAPHNFSHTSCNFSYAPHNRIFGSKFMWLFFDWHNWRCSHINMPESYMFFTTSSSLCYTHRSKQHWTVISPLEVIDYGKSTIQGSFMRGSSTLWWMWNSSNLKPIFAWY